MRGSPDSKTGTTTKEFLRNRAADGWGDFVEHYGRTIHRWCRRYWRLGEEEADDLTQVVVVKLFEKMQRRSALWDPAKGRFHAWLKRVAHRAWLDALKERRRALGPGGNKVLELLESDVVGADFVEKLVWRDLLQVAMERAQVRVTKTKWEVFRLRKVEGLSAKAVAERVQLTVKTIDNYTSKVGKVLMEELEALERPSED
jgi:RNA polymerase sigma factor (sigma-70 family)